MQEKNGGQLARIIDVPLSGQRSLATVTAEIRAYQDAARKVVLSYSIEIGRRLVEAKSMVSHGEWGDYLREELGFSQSTANNHMRLFEAYGAEQMSLDGAALKSQAFADLSYTQALELLALPSEEEREAFVETHDLASMSTRDLREELKRRNEEQEPAERDESAEELREALETMSGLRKEDAERVKQLEAQASAANMARDEALQAKAAAKQASAEAERKAQAAAEDVARIKRELDQAKTAQKNAEAELARAKANPEIPKATLDKLKKEAEEAAKKAAEAGRNSAETQAAVERHLQAEKEAKEARETVKAQAAKLEAVQAEKERLEKALRLAAPEVAEFKILFAQAQEELNKCVDAIFGLPKDRIEGGVSAMRKLLEIIGKRLSEERWDATMPE